MWSSPVKTVSSVQQKAAAKKPEGGGNPFGALFGAAAAAAASVAPSSTPAPAKAKAAPAPAKKKAAVALDEGSSGGNPFAGLFGGGAPSAAPSPPKSAPTSGTQRRTPAVAAPPAKSSTRKVVAGGTQLRSRSREAAADPDAPLSQEEKEAALDAALARLAKAEAKAVAAREALKSPLASFFKGPFQSGVDKADAAVEAAQAEVEEARAALADNDIGKRALLVLLPLGALVAVAVKLLQGDGSDAPAAPRRVRAPKAAAPPKAASQALVQESLTPKAQTIVEDALKSGNGASAYDLLIKGK